MVSMLGTLAEMVPAPREPSPASDWLAHLGVRLADVLIFGAVGIVMMIIGFKLFDMMLPKLDFQAELGEKRNVPLAIVIAAFLLAIAVITYSAMHG